MEGFAQQGKVPRNSQASYKQFKFSSDVTFEESPVAPNKHRGAFKTLTENKPSPHRSSSRHSRASENDPVDKLQREIRYLTNKVASLESEKQLHIDNHASEVEKLRRINNELRSEIGELKRRSSREIHSLQDRCKSLESSLEELKATSIQKIQYYKKKCLSLAAALSDKDPQTLRRTSTVRRSKRSISPLLKSQSRKSPVDPPRTDRAPAKESLDSVRKMIVALEANQAECKHQHHALSSQKEAPTHELERLTQQMKHNEHRLREAKRLQEHLIRSSFDM